MLDAYLLAASQWHKNVTFSIKSLDLWNCSPITCSVFYILCGFPSNFMTSFQPLQAILVQTVSANIIQTNVKERWYASSIPLPQGLTQQNPSTGNVRHTRSSPPLCLSRPLRRQISNSPFLCMSHWLWIWCLPSLFRPLIGNCQSVNLFERLSLVWSQSVQNGDILYVTELFLIVLF